MRWRCGLLIPAGLLNTKNPTSNLTGPMGVLILRPTPKVCVNPPGLKSRTRRNTLPVSEKIVPPKITYYRKSQFVVYDDDSVAAERADLPPDSCRRHFLSHRRLNPAQARVSSARLLQTRSRANRARRLQRTSRKSASFARRRTAWQAPADPTPNI